MCVCEREREREREQQNTCERECASTNDDSGKEGLIVKFKPINHI